MPAQKNQKTKTVDAGVIAEHYQKTFDLAYNTWQDRNKLFVALVLTAGLGLLLLLRVPTAASLLVDAIAKFLSISDPVRKADLQNAFPFDILLSGILVAMFYLMQRLYSTNLSVMRNFIYLGALEEELRSYLGLPANSVAFTREGKFYWGRRTVTQSMSKWYYVVVLLLILGPFIYLKLQSDLFSGNALVIVVDASVSFLTLLFWWEYTRSSVRLDVQSLTPEKK